MNGRAVTAKAILLIFVLCAVFDFVWGCVRGHSILAGVVGVVLGLFGTAVYCLLFGVFRKDKGESGSSRR